MVICPVLINTIFIIPLKLLNPRQFNRESILFSNSEWMGPYGVMSKQWTMCSSTWMSSLITYIPSPSQSLGTMAFLFVVKVVLDQSCEFYLILCLSFPTILLAEHRILTSSYWLCTSSTCLPFTWTFGDDCWLADFQNFLVPSFYSTSRSGSLCLDHSVACRIPEIHLGTRLCLWNNPVSLSGKSYRRNQEFVSNANLKSKLQFI